MSHLVTHRESKWDKIHRIRGQNVIAWLQGDSYSEDIEFQMRLASGEKIEDNGNIVIMQHDPFPF